MYSGETWGFQPSIFPLTLPLSPSAPYFPFPLTFRIAVPIYSDLSPPFNTVNGEEDPLKKKKMDVEGDKGEDKRDIDIEGMGEENKKA